MDQQINNNQENQIEDNQAQRIFTNHLISSNRRSYTNFSQSQIIQSNLSLLMEKILTHILSEQLLDIGEQIQVDKCELELFCSKITIQQLKELIFTQNSQNFHYQQLQHYQNFEKDLELIKQQIDPRRLRGIILQCNKLVVTYKSIQLLINKFKVQIYSNTADGELSRLQCYSILEKIQAEFQHLHKFNDLIKNKLAEKNEISQFLYYPIKDIYKQEIRKQFCQIFLQKEQQIKQKTEIQPTLTINRKLTTARQSTMTLLRPTKHLASLSNDQKISDEVSIRSKITQHFSSIDRKIANDQSTLNQISSLKRYQMKYIQNMFDTLTLKLFESIYVTFQTNFLVNNVEEVFELYGEKINLNLLQNFQKQIKCPLCINIFNQLLNNHQIQLSEEICSKDIKKKCKLELKLIADLFNQEQLIKIQNQIHYINKLTTEYLNKLTNLIYQLLENNLINLESLNIEMDNSIINDDFKYKLYGQSLLMLKHLTNNSILQLQPLSIFLSKTKFLEQSNLLFPFSQQVICLNSSINQILHQAQNEIVSNLLFETYICIQSKHIIDRRDQIMPLLNLQSKQILEQISQIIQGKVLKQQISSYASKKPQLYDLNDVLTTIEWLFDQHILKKHIIKPIEIIDEFSFFITQIVSQIKAMFDEEVFNENIKSNRISCQLQLFENYVKQEILKKPQDQQLKIQWSNKIFRLFHKINNELIPTSRSTTRRKQTTEPKDQLIIVQSPSTSMTKSINFKTSIYVKGNKTAIQNTERLTQSTVKIKEIEKKII